MKLDKLVTVGIPCYNDAKYIGYAISSVLKQTYKNFELIITDDGSTDNTEDVVRGFNDDRIQYIRSEENKGISYRLNQQIDLAKGRYFIRMDADDIMMPDRLERQINYLENHPDLDVIGASVIVINDDNEIIGFRRAKERSREECCGETVFIHPSVAGKVDYFRRFGYSEKFAGVEDMHLWTISSDKAAFGWMPEPVLFYRERMHFRLSTYIRRGVISRRLSWYIFKIGKYTFRESLNAIIQSLLKTLFVCFICLIGMTQLLIERRNQDCPEKEKFRNILKGLI